MAMPNRQPLAVMIGLKAKNAKKGADDADPKETDGDSENDDEPDHDPDDAELAACQDVIDAMAKKDPGELSTALHHWMQIAGYSKSEE